MDRLDLGTIENVFTGRDIEVVEKHKYSSVLMPVFEKDGEIHVLFELRAKNMKAQPGEVCFPGGRMEKGESPLETALRETEEEIGLPREKVRIVCELDKSMTYYGATIYRFLGIVPYEALNELVINESEVDEVFSVPLKYFLENEPYMWIMEFGSDNEELFPFQMVGLDHGYAWGKFKMDCPIYNYEGYCIWGLTGRMMMNFVKILRENGYGAIGSSAGDK